MQFSACDRKDRVQLQVNKMPEQVEAYKTISMSSSGIIEASNIGFFSSLWIIKNTSNKDTILTEDNFINLPIDYSIKSKWNFDEGIIIKSINN